MRIDYQNVYSGSYALSGGSGTWTGQALTAGTTLSTNVIDHNPSQTPFGTNQDIQIGPGEPMAIVLEVTAAPGHTGSETYTVNLLTDTASNLTTNNVTLASLTIPNTTAANTQFVLFVPASLNFHRYSGLQYVLADGGGSSSLNVVAFMLPAFAIQNAATYQTGWVIQNQ
jgi:hypothetical protein